LLAADGQPMLLDFHLARGPVLAGSPAPAWLGGTPGYMAPEQRTALKAVVERQPITVGVDGRADIYALGMMLCELLGGQLPSSDEEPVAATCRNNGQVTPDLSTLLRQCLEADPDRRYPTAG